jgi:drug/metabolite transporter superfamily protein YnfA
VFGLALGVVVTFLGLHSGDFLYLAVGGLLIWVVAVLWSRRIEKDEDTRMDYPLSLE